MDSKQYQIDIDLENADRDIGNCEKYRKGDISSRVKQSYLKRFMNAYNQKEWFYHFSWESCRFRVTVKECECITVTHGQAE